MRISGKELDKKKQIYVSLQDIFGIGETSAKKICGTCHIDFNIKTSNITDEQSLSIQQEIEKHYMVENDLRNQLSKTLRLAEDIKLYRATRKRLGLPSNGQRTKSNCRTSRKMFGRRHK